MKNTHGTDFSRMMRSMQGPRQVGSLGVMRPQPFRSFTQTRRDSKDIAEETSVLPRRISADLLVSSRKTPQATRLFLRKFSTDSQEVEFQSARAAHNQAQINEIKSQLIKLVDEEIKESQQEIDFCNAFLARTGFRLTTGPEGRITLTKAMGKISVTVWFSIDEKENEGEETEESEDSEGEVQEISSEDRVPGAGIDVVAQITLVDKSNKELTKLTLSCLAELDKLFIVTMHSADGNSVLEFDELSDKLQWKIYEYFESLALDNELAQFVTQYVTHSHDHKNVAVLKDLKLTLLSC